MTLIRTDQQVALNTALVATETSADHYHAVAEHLNDSSVCEALRRIGDERNSLSQSFKAAIRNHGDLPPEPDTDRESLEQLVQQIGAAIAPDQTVKVLEQRLDAEQKLAAQVADTRDAKLDAASDALFTELIEHIHSVTERLQTLLKQHSR